MKTKFILIVCALLTVNILYAQNGLQQLIIEKYYVSNAADSASASTDLASAGYSTGTLPSGSVTYRIYADLLPNWGIQSVFGVSNHPLTLTTTGNFFNHPNGGGDGGPFGTASAGILGSGTTLLDSYISCGGVAPSRFGVIKTEDNSAAIPTGGGANYILPSATILANNDPTATPPLTTFDGIYRISVSPTLLALTLIGDVSTPALNLLTDGAVVGNTFASNNCSWGVLGEQVGAFPTGTNKVLIGQFTSKGVFSYNFNIQIRNNVTFAVQTFVAANPVAAERLMPSLSGTTGLPVIISFNPTSGVVGTSVTINGSGFYGTTTVAFNGTSAPFTINSAGQITAIVPVGATTGSISVQNNNGTGFSSTNFTVISNSVTLNITAMIEGLYAGSSTMTGIVSPTIADTISVEIHNSTSPFALVQSYSTTITNTGLISVVIPGAYLGNSYYIVLRHRNSIETWSKFPVTLSSITNYNLKD